MFWKRNIKLKATVSHWNSTLIHYCNVNVFKTMNNTTQRCDF